MSMKKRLISLLLAALMLALNVSPAMAQVATPTEQQKDPATSTDLKEMTNLEFTYDGQPHSATVENAVSWGNNWKVTIAVRYVKDGALIQEAAPKDVGTYSVEGSFKASYNGNEANKPTKTEYDYPNTWKKVGTIKINPANIAGAEVKTVENLTYAGTEITPASAITSVTLGGMILQEGTDYTLSKATQKADTGDAIEYTATLTGKGNFTGDRPVEYSVTKQTGFTVQLSATEHEFTSKGAVPEVSVKAGDQTLDIKNFDVAFVDAENKPVNRFVNAGTYQVVVTGKGNYNGTAGATYTVKPAKLIAADLKETSEGHTYTKEGVEPTVKVSHDGVALTKDSDFTVKMLDPKGEEITGKLVDAGTYTLLVTGKGNYTGTVSKTYEIAAADLSKAKITLAADATYTREGVMPADVVKKVTVDGVDLKYSTDYQIGGADKPIMDAGTYRLMLSGVPNKYGKVNYQGTARTADYTINKCKIDKTAVVELDPENPDYTGEVYQPVKKVTVAGMTLLPSEYTVTTDKELKAQGAYKITIAAVKDSNFEGSVTIPYTINPQDMNKNGAARLEHESHVYTREGNLPEVIVEDQDVKGKLLTEGVDYTVTFVDAKNKQVDNFLDVGLYQALVKPVNQGNFKGEGYQLPYEVKPAALSEAKLTLDKTAYKGKDVIPDEVKIASVKAGEIELTADEFAIEYLDAEGNPVTSFQEVGKYAVKVKAISPNFEGEITLPFEIEYGVAEEPATLVGTQQNGWYNKTLAQITAPKGYTISKGGEKNALATADSAWSAFITYEDVECKQGVQSYYLKKDEDGSITDVMTIDYMQDTTVPKVNVKFQGAHVILTADDANEDAPVSGVIASLYLGNDDKPLYTVTSTDKETGVKAEWLIREGGNYRLVVVDQAGNTTTFGTKPENMKEWTEQYYADSDKDGLCDEYERNISKTDPQNPDSDHDGLSDGEEVRLGTNPNSGDTDGDGLSDYQEVREFHTDPKKADANKDGLGDFITVCIRSYFASDETPAGLAISLNNKVNKAESKLAGDALADAVKKLEDNMYIQLVQVNVYEGKGRNVLFGKEAVALHNNLDKLRMTHMNLEDRSLYGVHLEKGMFVCYDVDEIGKFTPKKAYNLLQLLGVDSLENVSVMADDHAKLFVLASWDDIDKQAATDLYVILPEKDLVWSIPDTKGCKAFAVAPDASRIAYLKDGKATMLDLVSGTPLLDKLQVNAQMLAFMQDGAMVTEIKGIKATAYTPAEDGMELLEKRVDFYGCYDVEQPTMNGHAMNVVISSADCNLVDDGTVLSVVINGYASSARSSHLSYQNLAEDKPQVYLDYLR